MSDFVPGVLSVNPVQWPREGKTGGQRSLSPWMMTPVQSWEQSSQCQRKALMNDKATGINVKFYYLI